MKMYAIRPSNAPHWVQDSYTGLWYDQREFRKEEQMVQEVRLDVKDEY